MPRHKSAIKRMKQERVARARNSAVRSSMRTAIKKVRRAQTREDAQKALQVALSVIDKTANKGVIHKNTAARYKSRLTMYVNTLKAE
ncbi:MAG TPA: 30S ribosomal protein S20 [Candidatus Latescibacteria bacterium]|nr:30S ribosomal protein S20 [Candidatus Latescibacterota bacterium]